MSHKQKSGETGHDNTPLVMPYCGITQGDIKSIMPCPSAKQAVVRIGVEYSSFLIALDRCGIRDWFPDKRGGSKKRITRRRLFYYSKMRMIKSDIAKAMGVNYSYLCKRIREENMQSLFLTRGESISVSLKGYT